MRDSRREPRCSRTTTVSLTNRILAHSKGPYRTPNVSASINFIIVSHPCVHLIGGYTGYITFVIRNSPAYL